MWSLSQSAQKSFGQLFWKGITVWHRHNGFSQLAYLAVDLACLRWALLVAWDLVRIDLLRVEGGADASEARALAKGCRRPSTASARPETSSESRFGSFCCAARRLFTVCI